MRQFDLSIRVCPSSVIKVIGWIVFTTIALAIVGLFFRFYIVHNDVYGLVPKFNLDAENTVPAFVSSINLFIAAGILALISLFKKKTKDKYWKQWVILSCLFFLLSLDEAASIHEMMAGRTQVLLNLPGAAYYTGVILFTTIVILFLLYFKNFILMLPHKTRMRFMVAGTVYISGVIGGEALGGYTYDLYGMGSMTYNLAVVVEESLEMLGILLFIKAQLCYMEESLLDKGELFQSVPNHKKSVKPANRSVPIETV
ncbi:hypothetical protein ACFSKU_08025 [Pontibacter silvestris]|uniref:Multidrug transporter n=1 Tax=Pontibacter silvestris TaxID=2305183 RepID=A0ABW4WVQ2_9BACT|nr:hypothetical protein [Pontibacter silvestris]MCC9137324.1 hypothetical protein [Pontibacter silvestris]